MEKSKNEFSHRLRKLAHLPTNPQVRRLLFSFLLLTTFSWLNFCQYTQNTSLESNFPYLYFMSWTYNIIYLSTPGLIYLSAVADHSILQDDFSTRVMPGTSWSVTGGELTIVTAYQAGAWFGNHPFYDTVPWEIADNSSGNFLSVRAKLGQDSGEWDIYLNDMSYTGHFKLRDVGTVRYRSGIGYLDYTIDTTAYHDYSNHLANGQVLYTIDGNVICSGTASSSSFINKALYIGDTSGSAISGFGSMIIERRPGGALAFVVLLIS